MKKRRTITALTVSAVCLAAESVALALTGPTAGCALTLELTVFSLLRIARKLDLNADDAVHLAGEPAPLTRVGSPSSRSAVQVDA
ncbi:hypothetical protein [Amycolatopsis saalfeldensis]|uniref:hypothetical protein n=1 Tax=Amycolatopsis saalfeldensis TaxID=394193 RepID=UPI001160775C|nr:hypothetical protein [Amycolatopsis saalfeldensis]